MFTVGFLTPAAPLPLPEVRSLTPLRQQLAVAIERGVGRRTSADRLPKRTFDLPRFTERWAVLDGDAHRFDLLLITLLFADRAEPVGIEWIQGAFDPTRRDAVRGLALDLPRLASELQRAWPGETLAPAGGPPDRAALRPAGPGLRELEWPADTEFV